MRVPKMAPKDLEFLRNELAKPDGEIIPLPASKSAKDLALAIMKMAEEDKGLVLSKLEELIEQHKSDSMWDVVVYGGSKPTVDVHPKPFGLGVGHKNYRLNEHNEFVELPKAKEIGQCH